MAEEYWKSFWKNYRRVEFKTDKDLFYQVGKTINGEAISDELLNLMIDDIISRLDLQESDILLEMCCGNGLLTLPLSMRVKHIYALDFTDDLISIARQYRSSSNISYEVGDARSDITSIFNINHVPLKILMNDSLGYFTPEDLCNILKKLIMPGFRFYITGIPSDELKWNFYNTSERVKRYNTLKNNGALHFDGIGRWWHLDELRDIAKKSDVDFSFWEQLETISKYRVNAMFSKL